MGMYWRRLLLPLNGTIASSILISLAGLYLARKVSFAMSISLRTLKRRSLLTSAGSGRLSLSHRCTYSDSFLNFFKGITLLIPGTPNRSSELQYISSLGRLCIPIKIRTPRYALISAGFVSAHNRSPFGFAAIISLAYLLVCSTMVSIIVGLKSSKKKSFGVPFSAKLAMFGPVSCTKGSIPRLRVISDHPCLSLGWPTWSSTSDSKSFSRLSQSERSDVCTLLTLPTSMSDSARTSRSTMSSASKPKNGSSSSVESKISMAKLLKDCCPKNS